MKKTLSILNLLMDKGLTKKPSDVLEKEEHRKRLRNLSFPEKVKIVVQLQKIAAPILRARGIDARFWDI